MGLFRDWLQETTSSTTTGSVARVPMRVLFDPKAGASYIGVPGRPSPYDPKAKPTVIRRGKEAKEIELARFDGLDDQYDEPKEIQVRKGGKKK